jgi:hypothetical protein
VLYRIGIGLSLAGALGLTTGRLAWTPLRPMGQASLLLYWVHLEFAFGQSARLLKRALGYGAWMALAAVLIALMFGLALLRLHGPKRWAARQAKRADQAKNGQDAR